MVIEWWCVVVCGGAWRLWGAALAETVRVPSEGCLLEVEGAARQSGPHQPASWQGGEQGERNVSACHHESSQWGLLTAAACSPWRVGDDAAALVA